MQIETLADIANNPDFLTIYSKISVNCMVTHNTDSTRVKIGLIEVTEDYCIKGSAPGLPVRLFTLTLNENIFKDGLVFNTVVFEKFPLLKMMKHTAKKYINSKDFKGYESQYSIKYLRQEEIDQLSYADLKQINKPVKQVLNKLMRNILKHKG